MLFVILNKCLLCLCWILFQNSSSHPCFRFFLSLSYPGVCQNMGLHAARNPQGFVWKFFYTLYINFHSFIISTFPVDSTSFLPISLYFPLRGVPWAQKMRSKNQLLSKFLLYEGLERVRVYLALHGLSAADTFTIQKFLPTWFIQIMPTRSL